jgi:hypothetical protein
MRYEGMGGLESIQFARRRLTHGTSIAALPLPACADWKHAAKARVLESHELGAWSWTRAPGRPALDRVWKGRVGAVVQYTVTSTSVSQNLTVNLAASGLEGSGRGERGGRGGRVLRPIESSVVSVH